MPRLWTWLGILALVAGSVAVIDLIGGPTPASAQAGSSLTEPIPPATDQQRLGSVRNQIGWTKAKARLLADMPMGNNIPVGQVEALFREGYLPNNKHKDLAGTGVIAKSGDTEVSGHATNVARYAFGPDSAGQGVKEVHSYEAGHWMGEGFLKLGTLDPPANDSGARVFNHAWIMPGHISAPLIIRRIDYLVDHDDVIVVCGLANQPGRVPALLASAYNVISVGVASGMNTDGLTHIETEGRCKPEIVAPGDKTSWSTGVVTGVVAALLESADRLAEQDKPDAQGKQTGNLNANKSEVIRAVLFAGAQKPQGWAPPEGEPLDRKLGAGIVDLDRSLVMLQAGHAPPDQATRQRYAWSFATIESNKQRTYSFRIDKAQGETTLALIWNRKVLGGTIDITDPNTNEARTIWNSSAFCPDLDLELFSVDGQGKLTPVAASQSKVDNVELIYLPTLAPGKYELRVSRAQDAVVNEAWDYALAWRIEAGQ